MEKLRILFVFFWAFCCSFPVNAKTSTQESRPVAAQTTPQAWLVQKSQNLLNILSMHEVKTRYLKLRHFCKEVFNPKEMPRLAMGKYWKEMSPQQQEELQHLFFDYFVVTYGTFSLGFSNVSVQVTKTVPSGKDLLMKAQVEIGSGMKDGSVKTQGENHPIADLQKEGTFEIMFSLRQRAGGYYIRDAKIEGQSILMFLRSHLEKEYKEAGFDMERLLSGLRKKINDRYRAAEDLAKRDEAQQKNV